MQNTCRIAVVRTQRLMQHPLASTEGLHETHKTPFATLRHDPSKKGLIA